MALPDDRDVLPVNPTLRVREDAPHASHTPAEQGPAPADLEDREAPEVPPPTRERLSAQEVAALLGPDDGADRAATERRLEAAEGLDPDTES
ncbi:hypothetical protein RDMS_04060 [Deinococcus sp. RL]|uniref:hypothetical protein n=1 Tax=Deinococcus sp. RL TaxID=1489678 RepID=UPI0004D6A890|nr:hypothetical protein [Deinococcus sp. RL]KEF34981.1 hypothetical protein RDMS_04060 [Deinococcus sp. RL]